MTAQRLAPDALPLVDNLTGGIGDIQDDPDSPDGAWLTATNVADIELRAAFPTPSGDLTTGAGLQQFRILLRKTASGGNHPEVTIGLWENGSFIRNFIEGRNITNTTGQVESWTWDGAELSAISGANVEVRVLGKRSVGSPANRRAIDIGAVEWNADYVSAGVSGTLAASEGSDTAAVSGDVDVSGSWAASEALDTMATAGSVENAGSLAATEAADVAAIAGAVTIAGVLSASEPIDVAAITGALSDAISGSLAATEVPDTAAIAGAVAIAGLLSASEPIDVTAIAGTLSDAISGSLATTETADTSAIAGTVTIAGLLSASEPIDVTAIAGTLSDAISGSLAATEVPDTAALAGAVTIAGVLSPSEPIDVTAITGTLSDAISGSLAATEAADIALFSSGADFQPWFCQVGVSWRGPIVAQGSRQKLSANVTFDPIKSEAS